MIVDSHCHLDFPELYDQLDQIIERADLNNVKHLMTISTTLDSFKKIELIVKKYKNIYGTLGIHPHESKNFTYISSQEIKNLYNNNKKIIGIGETGLDFYYKNSEKNIQKKLFIEHIDAAIDLDLPIIVHTRNAEKDTIDILSDKKKKSNLKVLIHCFTGSYGFAKKLLDLDCYISISGIVTFKNSTELAKTVYSIPIDKLLVETDSPYLAPVPFRGKSNEPSYIKHTVTKLSDIKKISPADVEKHTSNNFFKLFDLQ